MVVFGQDSLDEISMSAPTSVCEIKDGKFTSYVLTPEQFARLSDFTSFGGFFSHLLSLLVFLGLASILLGVLAILATKKIYRHFTRYKS